VPELQFRGKEFVYNHHLTVPFRPLEMHADKGVGDARLDGNLIVHGEGTRERIVVIETKGEQLAGNRDTEYKRELLSLLSEKFDPTIPGAGGQLAVDSEAFDFNAAVVLFGEIDAKLPPLIRGEAVAAAN
jgi:hypothetical protein